MKKKIKKNRKLGQEYLEAWVELFQADIFQGDSPGWSLTIRNVLGGSFPKTKENIYEELSTVYALTLIFIRKIFIFQSHSLRIYSLTNNIFFPMVLKYFFIL